MRERNRGVLINVSSVVGHVPQPYTHAYVIVGNTAAQTATPAAAGAPASAAALTGAARALSAPAAAKDHPQKGRWRVHRPPPAIRRLLVPLVGGLLALARVLVAHREGVLRPSVVRLDAGLHLTGHIERHGASLPRVLPGMVGRLLGGLLAIHRLA